MPPELLNPSSPFKTGDVVTLTFGGAPITFTIGEVGSTSVTYDQAPVPKAPTPKKYARTHRNERKFKLTV